jgi:Na+-transporting methylmalonyl-CoA/oxaloacetate decarboxylase gamma subunit
MQASLYEIMATLAVAYLLEGLFTVGRPFSWLIFIMLIFAVYGAATFINRIVPPPKPPPWRQPGD